MGTSYNIVAVDHTNLLDEQHVKSAVSGVLTAVNTGMSNWDATSEISRLNASPAGSALSVSLELADVLNTASLVNRASEGRFDMTVGPLIELWGFGAPGAKRKPNEAEVIEARAKTGLNDSLVLQHGTVEKTNSDAQVYLAGIGKGYGADHVGRAIEALGITDYLVEIGGDLYTAGRNSEGLPWQIGIEAPNIADRRVLEVVGVSGLGLASSGDYRNYFEEDGQRYSHLVDPATGRPVTHKTASATVLAENAMLADAWSTAMLILGRERGLEVAKARGVAVKFIERDPNAAGLQFKMYASDAFSSLTA
ncbi:MAG: FAD:protein FMN transferase [Paracoccaceae bacterium]